MYLDFLSYEIIIFRKNLVVIELYVKMYEEMIKIRVYEKRYIFRNQARPILKLITNLYQKINFLCSGLTEKLPVEESHGEVGPSWFFTDIDYMVKKKYCLFHKTNQK